jgi:Protein of unknown function (DUF3990)
MPIWKNRPAIFFHGTDTGALRGLAPAVHAPLPRFTVSLKRCRPNSDFGQGFYVTTNELQACEWANTRVRQARSAVTTPALLPCAVLLAFSIDRDRLGRLESLCFLRPTDDYYDLVDDCRLGFPPHQRTGGKAAYDVVYGPVRMWPQRLVIADADQISFNTPMAVAILPTPVVRDIANDPSGCFIP